MMDIYIVVGSDCDGCVWLVGTFTTKREAEEAAEAEQLTPFETVTILEDQL